MLRPYEKPFGFLSIMVIFVSLGALSFFFIKAKMTPTPATTTTSTLPAHLKTLSQNDPAIGKAIPPIRITQAKKEVGNQGSVLGILADSQPLKNSKDMLLHFEGNPTETILVVVSESAHSPYPDLNTLKGKKVLVEGEFFLFKDRPAIRITDPENLRILIP